MLENEIENIIYSAPWLLDNRFIVANIEGTGTSRGRQVCIKKNGLNRYIDLVFKDTKDDRPVIIELKKDILKRENIAQILEYRALLCSMDEELKELWLNEFGDNFYCPKLILIGMSASEEIIISANLAGIDIRVFDLKNEINISLNEIIDIPKKLESWNNFLSSGNIPLEERNDIIPTIFSWSKEVANSFDNNKISLANLKPTTGWIEKLYYPFLNFSFSYKDILLVGLFEFFFDKIPYSKEVIYFDFLINDFEDTKEIEIRSLIESRGYKIVHVENRAFTVSINRNILSSEEDYIKNLKLVIEDALYFNNFN